MALNYVDISYVTVAETTTPLTTVGVQASTHVALRVLEAMQTCDGSTSTATPAKVELCYNTFAGSPPGTNSTAVTIQRRDVQRDAFQFLGGKNWTSEPTVISVLRTYNVPQYNGSYHYICPLQTPYICPGSAGFSVRFTASANVNSSGHVTVEE